MQKSTHKPLQIRKKTVFSRETCITSPQSGHTTSFLPTSHRAAATSDRAVPASPRAKKQFPPPSTTVFMGIFATFVRPSFSLWIFKIIYDHAPSLLRRVVVLYYPQENITERETSPCPTPSTRSAPTSSTTSAPRASTRDGASAA